MTRTQHIEVLRTKIDAMRANPSLVFVDPPALQPEELFLQIGRKRYQIASIREAVAMYVEARD